MATTTPRLGLYKPGGGSTGLITPDEAVDIDKINGNMDIIDAAMGAKVVTSTGRPPTPVDGQVIRETDTRNTLIWSAALTRWIPVGTPYAATNSARDALYPSPMRGDRVFRQDLGYFEEYYDAAATVGNPAAGWVPAAGTVFTYTPIANPFNTTPLGAGGLNLPMGAYLIEAQHNIDTSTAAPVQYAADIYNTATGAVLASSAVRTGPTIEASALPLVVSAVVFLSATLQSIHARRNSGGVTGSQNTSLQRFTATALGHITQA